MANRSAQRDPAVWGLLAEYHDTPSIYHAAEKVRDAGFKKWDSFGPFAVHGLDEAMGAPRSKVAWIMGTGAFTGVACAYLMQWWMSSVDYPMVVAGKPFTAWEQWMPIMFELGVLLSAFGAIFGMLALNGLPRWYHPVMKHDRFLRASDDRFFIAIEAADPLFDVNRTRDLLAATGASHIEVVSP